MDLGGFLMRNVRYFCALFFLVLYSQFVHSFFVSKRGLLISAGNTVKIGEIRELIAQNGEFNTTLLDVQYFFSTQLNNTYTLAKIKVYLRRLMDDFKFEHNTLLNIKIVLLAPILQSLEMKSVYENPQILEYIHQFAKTPIYTLEEEFSDQPLGVKCTTQDFDESVFYDLIDSTNESLEKIKSKYKKAWKLNIPRVPYEQLLMFNYFWVENREKLYQELLMHQETNPDDSMRFSIHSIKPKNLKLSLISTQPGRFFLDFPHYINPIGYGSYKEVKSVLLYPSGRLKTLSLMKVHNSYTFLSFIKEMEVNERIKHIPQVLLLEDKGFTLMHDNKTNSTYVGGVSVSELMDGSLYEFRDIFKGLSFPEKKEILKKLYFQMSKAMLAIHREGIFIGDISSGNILYKENKAHSNSPKSSNSYDFKLMDFGFAYEEKDLPSSSINGTPLHRCLQFVAWRFIRGDKQSLVTADQAKYNDQYSLAATILLLIFEEKWIYFKMLDKMEAYLSHYDFDYKLFLEMYEDLLTIFLKEKDKYYGDPFITHLLNLIQPYNETTGVLLDEKYLEEGMKILENY